VKRSSSKQSLALGVFDSGLGGLTIVRHIQQVLPQESIVYFGDLAHLPYGTKSNEQIRCFSLNNTRFLLKRKVKAIVVACNSSASSAGKLLRSTFSLPIVDVIQPAAQDAVSRTKLGRIGVIATQATIDSGAYPQAIHGIRKTLKVFSKAAPLLVPLVEEGWLDHPLTRQILVHYLKDFLKKRIDVLILGCTHYPLLKPLVKHIVGSKIQVVDSVSPSVAQLKATLQTQNLLDEQKKRIGKLQITLSDRPRNFIRIGSRFLGRKIKKVEVVRIA